MSTLIEKQPSHEDLDEKGSPTASSIQIVNYKDGVDVAAGLAAGHADDAPVPPDVAHKLRVKLDWHLLPLLCALYTLQFMDKLVITNAAIMGFIPQNHLTTNEFNNIGSAFYIGYLIFAWPQALMLQRFPVAKYLGCNMLLWALFVGLMSQCHTYSKLFAMRFLLGATESVVSTAVLILLNMFYKQVEIGERIGWTFQCTGVSSILSGFIAFGALHISPKHYPNSYEWFFIIISLVTVVVATLVLLFLPDNPTSARFLTPEEKFNAVRRIKDNQNGIETKVWKRHQMIEAFKDPKVWLFAFWAGISNMQNGVNVQYSIIIQSFGFTTLQTTLLNIPGGVATIIGITSACLALRFNPNARAYIAVLWLLPEILAAILLMTLTTRAGLLTSFYLLNMGGVASVVMLYSWITSTISGHTKRVTANGIMFVLYATGNVCATQYWKQKYRPRDHVPFGINLATYVAGIAFALTLRYLLNNENKRRDAMKAQAEASGSHEHAYDQYGYIDIVGPDGKPERKKIDKTYMDLTDKENLSFRYVL